MSSFKNIRIVDNFYQTSAFVPMPTVLISTLTLDGERSEERRGGKECCCRWSADD